MPGQLGMPPSVLQILAQVAWPWGPTHRLPFLQSAIDGSHASPSFLVPAGVQRVSVCEIGKQASVALAQFWSSGLQLTAQVSGVSEVPGGATGAVQPEPVPQSCEL